MSLGTKQYIQGWTFERFAKNLFKVYISGSTYYMTGTGSAVSKQLSIPFPFRLNRFYLYQTDNNNAESTYSFDLTIERSSGSMQPAIFQEYLFDDNTISLSRLTEKYGEGFEFEPSIIKVIVTGTNTYKFIPIFYIQSLEGNMI